MKKPFAWYGGKGALAPFLASLLPAHTVYCEVFGGSGALLFAKAPSPLEVFNDLDSGVVNFFRVLRHPEQAQALQEALKLTPYAREEYYACLQQWEVSPDPVERARAWYCTVMQSMNSSIRATGWSSTKRPDSHPARSWHNTIAHFSACIGRLAHVQIDHRDFEAVLRAYDGPETLFYLASWECLSLAQFCSSAVRPHIPPQAQVRQECIWRNPHAVRRSQGLFSHEAAAWDEEARV